MAPTATASPAETLPALPKMEGTAMTLTRAPRQPDPLVTQLAALITERTDAKMTGTEHALAFTVPPAEVSAYVRRIRKAATQCNVSTRIVQNSKTGQNTWAVVPKITRARKPSDSTDADTKTATPAASGKPLAKSAKKAAA